MMENYTSPVSSFPHSRETALLRTAGVAGNPYLAAGLLLGYFLLGLASVSWAFRSHRSSANVFKQSITLCQHSRLNGVQIVHNSLFALLFIEGFSAVIAVILAIMLVTSACNHGLTCAYIFSAWFLFRCYVVVLHLQSALVSIFYLCHPEWGAKLRYVSKTVAVFLSIFVVFYVFFGQIATFLLAVIVFGLALAIIVKCAVSSVSLAAPAASKKPFVFVAMFTFLFVYAPTFVLQCLIISSANSWETTDKYLIVYVNVLFFTNFHLLLDGLLSFFILKLPTGEGQQQLS
ncbi:uncharacterized protein LOC119027453 [Acanthopagrus latus]|uniref:uncharacterized protein LOC119027453 n=1 Tax=Acanthopagrus latus TaxID=8177 RepID=UPI00187C5BE1|nr:uncharacterized protein LOC119027453 [Acanthopagrus latus]